jgi:hypothetical protein
VHGVGIGPLFAGALKSARSVVLANPWNGGTDYQIFSLSLRGPTAFDGQLTETVRVPDGRTSVHPLIHTAMASPPFSLALVDLHGAVLAFLPPRVVWKDVTLPAPLVLANGDGTRALIIPADASGKPVTLARDTYRFDFELTRTRVRDATPDSFNTYRDSAIIVALW